MFKCFAEIINIGYAVYKMDNLPWFRSLSWYFLVASNYFFYGESLVEQFGVLINNVDFLPFLVRYHRLISFSMYIIGNIIISILKIISVVFRVCLVCPLPGQEILPAPVFSLCLDTRGSSLCRHPVIPHHPEHVPGPHLAHHACHHGHHQ